MRVALFASDPVLTKSFVAAAKADGDEVLAFAEPEAALARLAADTSIEVFVAAAATAEAGINLCREARRRAPPEQSFHVILVSAPLAPEQEEEALEIGVDDLLRRPSSAGEARARLRIARRLGAMRRKLAEVATRDGLTGLLTRPAFFERAARLCRDAAAPFAAIMADVDHLKAINARFGADAGDRALEAVAQCLGARAELAGRLAGEEFALLLPGLDAEGGWAVADALRREIAGREIAAGRASFTLSCSFGVAMGAPDDDIDDLLRRADSALYAAKRAGRDLVAFHDPETPALPSPPHSVVREAGKPGARRRKPS